MFDHLEFFVADIDASRRFYDAVCRAIGLQEIVFDEGEKSVGFGQDGVVDLLLTEGQATAPGKRRPAHAKGQLYGSLAKMHPNFVVKTAWPSIWRKQMYSMHGCLRQ